MKNVIQQHILPTPVFSFFLQAEDGIRDVAVTGVQTCALPISTTATKTPRNNNNTMPTPHHTIPYHVNHTTPKTPKKLHITTSYQNNTNNALHQSTTPHTTTKHQQHITSHHITSRHITSQYTPSQHRSEEHTSELQSRLHLVCRLLLEKKKKQ